MNRIICNKIITSLITLLVLFLLAGGAGAAHFEEWKRTFTGAGNAAANSARQMPVISLQAQHTTRVNMAHGLSRPMHGAMSSGIKVFGEEVMARLPPLLKKLRKQRRLNSRCGMI